MYSRTKAQQDQIQYLELKQLGYYTYVFPHKKRNSGVAILLKRTRSCEYGMNMSVYDREGRFIRQISPFIDVSVYHPSEVT